MYNDKTVAVVVTAYNESANICRVVSGIPAWVDRVYVVDDASTDGTRARVEAAFPGDGRVAVLAHGRNRGVGAAIATGYRRALAERMGCVVTIGGDGQMDPEDMLQVVAPVVTGAVDFCKGNRFAYPEGFARIPPVRLFGNFVLSIMTKLASGYWHVTDTQTGYTAIALQALERIDIDDIYPRYGCPNDILIKLNIAGCRVGEVPVNPIYGVGEVSKMRIPRVVFPILGILAKGWFRRLYRRCAIMEGNPFVLGVLLSLTLLCLGGVVGAYLIAKFAVTGHISNTSLGALTLVSVTGLQFGFYSVQADYVSNRHRCVTLHEMRDLAANGRNGADG